MVVLIDTSETDSLVEKRQRRMVDKDTTFLVMMSFCKTSENFQMTSSKLTAYQTAANGMQMQILQSRNFNLPDISLTFP